MNAKESDALISKVRDAHDPTPGDYERVLAGLPAKIAAPPVQLVTATPDPPEGGSASVASAPRDARRSQLRIAIMIGAIAGALLALVVALAIELHAVR